MKLPRVIISFSLCTGTLAIPASPSRPPCTLDLSNETLNKAIEKAALSAPEVPAANGNSSLGITKITLGTIVCADRMKECNGKCIPKSDDCVVQCRLPGRMFGHMDYSSDARSAQQCIHECKNRAGCGSVFHVANGSPRLARCYFFNFSIDQAGDRRKDDSTGMWFLYDRDCTEAPAATGTGTSLSSNIATGSEVPAATVM